MEVVNVFEEKFLSIIKDKISSVLLESNESDDDNLSKANKDRTQAANSLSCSYCRAEFATSTAQREHYKLDWHRYNLRQSLLQKSPITEEEFFEKNAKDDISSISGSDSEEETLDTYATAQGKVFLKNNTGKVFSIYSALLHNKKETVKDEIIQQRLVDSCKNPKWAILMLGGGHFAAAVFSKNEAILHKTFHCYTVRAGQGGAQSSRDNKGSASKSAGSSLRRYNEQSLVQHVKSILEAWLTHLKGCGLIFYRAAGPYNRSALFGGNAPFLDKNDERLRSIPFSTRRPTFTEVQRVHKILSSAHVYEDLEVAVEKFAKTKNADQKRTKARSGSVNRAKSREVIERPLPVDIVESDSSENDNDILLTDFQEISFDLQEFEDTLTSEQRYKKKKKPKKSKTQKLKKLQEQQRNELIEILSRGQIEKLEQLLKENEAEDFINKVLDEDGNTLLHVAAMNEQNEILLYLVNKSANICLKNNKNQTAYTVTQSKEIRESLKEFARKNPEKFNYNKAHIPTNVLTPDELVEKKKAQRKVKREKEKIKKKENETKKKETEEKERFLKLSDREKRALAAERRILSQSGTVIVRCFLCGGDMTGKVPFEYSSNRFCSVECLKAHRMQNPVILS